MSDMTKATDRELLELAAKAAGLQTWPEGYCDLLGVSVLASDGMPDHHWNPLERNDEALWLAVKLQLLVDVAYAHVEVRGQGQNEFTEPTGTDPLAATRRAIVRSGAEIGRAAKALGQ